MNVQKRMEGLMALKGWTMYRLAQEAGLSSSTVSHMFEKENTPTLPTIEAVCKAFGLTLGQFFAERGEAVVLTPEQEELLVRWGTMSDRETDFIKDAMELFKGK